MIGKIFPKSSGSFRKRIRYIFGCTKHDHEISQIVTIDSNCISSDPLPGILTGSEYDMMEMIKEFDQVEMLRRMSIDSDRPIKPIFHAMMSLRPGESLTNEQWRTAVRKYLTDLGFPESCIYVAVMHRDRDHEHVHIVANRIMLDDDFKMVKDSNERSLSIDSVSEIEDKFGLHKAPKPKETWGTALTHAEVKASIRDGDLPLKHRMIAKIAGAIEHTKSIDGDMFDFVMSLRKQKVYLHLTLNDEGQPKGISYEYDGKHISGRQLKRSRLTWHKLTTQEGISYDPETISDLQIEIARRDQGDQNRIAERFWYFSFYSRTRRFAVKFEPKSRSQREIDALVEAIQAFLSAIFGVPLESKKERERRDAEYIEYVPTLILTRKMFGIVDRRLQETTLDP